MFRNHFQLIGTIFSVVFIFSISNFIFTDEFLIGDVLRISILRRSQLNASRVKSSVLQCTKPARKVSISLNSQLMRYCLESGPTRSKQYCTQQTMIKEFIGENEISLDTSNFLRRARSHDDARAKISDSHCNLRGRLGNLRLAIIFSRRCFFIRKRAVYI